MMMKARIFTLPVLLALLLSGIYLLPTAREMAPSAVNMKLPEMIGLWTYRHRPPSQDELRMLASDTEFSKAVCLSPRPGEYDFNTGSRVPDRIDLSVVLSGHDLNNSIHRPERCMPAQGHTILSSGNVDLELPNGQRIPCKRLLSTQTLPINQEQTEFATYQCLTYYFFVGNHRLTNSHTGRTIIDMKDRLLLGMDQRWAYVSASMWYGKVPWIENEVGIDEADEKIREFLIDFGLEQIDWQQIK